MPSRTSKHRLAPPDATAFSVYIFPKRWHQDNPPRLGKFEKCYADQMQLNYILICTVLVKWTRQIFKSFCSFRVVISGLKITCHKLQYVFIWTYGYTFSMDIRFLCFKGNCPPSNGFKFLDQQEKSHYAKMVPYGTMVDVFWVTCFLKVALSTHLKQF